MTRLGRLMEEASLDYSIHAVLGADRHEYIADYLMDRGVTLEPTCEGHVEPSDESYTQLRERYGDDSIGLVAELAKKNAERKVMHQILTDAGIPSETPSGRGLCLIARLAILAERVG